MKHAIEGFNQMPARGGNSELSDLEVTRAVVYLANSAGVSFTDPEPAAAPAAAVAAPDATADATADAAAPATAR